MAKRFDEIDQNFKAVAFSKDGFSFYNVDNEPFSIYGVYRDGEKYRRMPEAVAKEISDGVHFFHANTAGGRVRFRTNSSRVAISLKMANLNRGNKFTLCGSCGCDLYADDAYVSTFVPPYDMVDSYESCLPTHSGEWHDYMIHLPLYSEVISLHIGLDEDAGLEAASPYQETLPVVYYGSSITQGGCASRPGLAYEAILSRKFHCDFVNLGFSGSAKAEPRFAEYIKTLPMKAFVYDYDFNAPNLEHLKNTHEAMFRVIREANPTLPIILLSRPKGKLIVDEPERIEVIKTTYRHAVEAGDQNVYFIDGPTLMALCGTEGNEGTVDNCHPNDFGFVSMAAALEKVMREFM